LINIKGVQFRRDTFKHLSNHALELIPQPSQITFKSCNLVTDHKEIK